MGEAKTATVKYVFLDIVDFTKNRSVEAQSDLVKELNNIVKEAIQEQKMKENANIIYLPTGDGICIALIGVCSSYDYDIDIQIALSILKHISSYNNTKTQDKMRQFQVRIGVNQNVDNLVFDITGRLNVAGDGVNMAQRIMDQAESGQLIVSHNVYERLYRREIYMNQFHRFTTVDKHGHQFEVYQYIDQNREGLNTSHHERVSLKTIRHKDISELVNKAIQTTSFWWYTGHVGRYIRTSIVPRLAIIALTQRKFHDIRLVIMDPTKSETSTYYTHYRNSVGCEKPDDSPDAFRASLCSTILCSHLWNMQNNPFLKIEVRLANCYSILRVDLCSEFVLVTTEKTDEPVLHINAGSSIYDSYMVNFELLFKQSRELGKSTRRLNVDSLTEEGVSGFFEDIGLEIEKNSSFIQKVIKDANNKTIPYSNLE